MYLERVTLAGFRCFGPTPVSTSLAEAVTAIIGSNGAGKTAILQALSKVFGVSRAQRTIHRSDFHTPVGTDPADRSSRQLFVDVVIALSELRDGTATPETIAPSFRHMRIERMGAAPICRIRLEAQWEDDGTADGEVAQNLFWIDTLEAQPEDDQKHQVSAADRGLVQLYYTPASREPANQIKASTGALAARLLRAIEWSSTTQSAVKAAATTLGDAFKSEAAIAAIGEALTARWSALHDGGTDTEPHVRLVSHRFEEVVSHINVIFQRGPDGFERELESLSEGQQSLFYFALAAAVFDLERKAVGGTIHGFHADQLRIPALSLFALEEPENHLSPFYLARIIRQARSLVRAGAAQVLVTSHSPSVLSRVEPREVRYCRLDPKSRTSTVKAVTLPEGEAEAIKFIRGALLSFPELYFARFVLLVEGDSERVVLPRLAEALDLLVDPAFVAIVPLGGRHVQHLWRLLSDLEIPYATLLDLDLGRHGGGFGRIKVALQQLIALGVSKAELLRIADGSVLPDTSFESMHTWHDAGNVDLLKGWLDGLQARGVFFSAPLDLDLTMLAAFPEAYNALLLKGGGPKADVESAAAAVFGTGGPGLKLYAGEYAPFAQYMAAYRYHFLTHSKPATHLAALAHLDNETLRTKMPATLSVVLNHIQAKVRRD